MNSARNAAELGAPLEDTSHGSWTRVCQRLRAEFGEDVYNSWFARLELDKVSNGVAHCSVPTKFLKSWIQSHYQERILSILSAEAAGLKGLVIEVRSGTRRSVPSAQVSLN